ncbi:MAG: T9SS type A sorting domain-containing protein [Bacteroidetes bacterium]|nr:T9SS type A sorting domain-containing protein [Bacteroidota bacterium]MBU1720509.1 T9SS type A sorting domain-containing protein [Bacteroidota bacterium]
MKKKFYDYRWLLLPVAILSFTVMNVFSQEARDAQTLDNIRSNTYSEDFNDGNAEGCLPWSSDWDIVPTYSNGEVSVVYPGITDNGLGMFSPVGAVGDFTYEVDVKRISASGDNAIGILVGTPGGKYLEYHVASNGTSLQLISGDFINSTYQVEYSESVNIGTSWHTMKIEVSGTFPTKDVTIWFDGVQKYTGQLYSLGAADTYGNVGFLAWGSNFEMHFDNVTMDFDKMVTTNQFDDDFSAGYFSGWNFFSNGWEITPEIVSQEMHVEYTSTEATGCEMVLPIGAVNNITLQADVKAGSSGAEATGCAFVEANGYVLEYHIIEGTTLQLVSGNYNTEIYTILFETPVSAIPGNVYPCKVQIDGSGLNKDVTIWWQGVEMFDTIVAFDEAYFQAALFTHGDDVNMYFDNVSATFESYITDVQTLHLISDEKCRIYPNPATDVFSVGFDEDVFVSLYSIDGSKILETNSKSVALANIGAGIYLVVIENNEQAVISRKKLIVQ